MKKVLSVLLAAAMVMGMSVTSMATNYSWTSGATGKVATAVGDMVEFSNQVQIVRNGVCVATETAGKALELQPGDDLYFPLTWKTGSWEKLNAETAYAGKYTQPVAGAWYTGPIDTNWSINIQSNGYVDAASYYTLPEDGKAFAWGTAVPAGQGGIKYVKVEIADDFESTTSTTAKFYMYLADGDIANNVSGNITVEATFANAGIATVNFDFTNDADRISRWKALKKGTAVFDFNDNVYFTVDMVPAETVVLNLSTAYHKNVDKLFDGSADVDFYNFKGSKDAFTKNGELFIPADEDTFIYEVVEYDLKDKDDVPVLEAIEAEWVDNYTVANVNKEFEGWVIDTDELGYYVISDVELEVEAEEEVVETPVVEDNKANPETGANDFVGAAVALAVVSVAAAGALALKK